MMGERAVERLRCRREPDQGHCQSSDWRPAQRRLAARSRNARRPRVSCHSRRYRFGSATLAEPKFPAPADPATRWTCAHGGQAYHACSTNDLTHIPVFDTSFRRDGIFARADVRYDLGDGNYICPAGNRLRPCNCAYEVITAQKTSSTSPLPPPSAKWQAHPYANGGTPPSGVEIIQHNNKLGGRHWRRRSP